MFDWNTFWSIIVKVIFSIAGVAAVSGIGYGIYYLRTKHPKSFADLKVIANTAVEAMVAYFKANPDVKIEAQLIYNLFVKYFTSLVPYATEDEVQSLFISVLQTVAAALGISVTEFQTVKVKIGEDSYKMLFTK